MAARSRATTAEPAFVRAKSSKVGPKPKLNRIIDRDAENQPITVGDHILATLAAGGYVETAAARAGISKNTVYEWLKVGARVRQRRSAGEPAKAFSDHELLCASFSSAVDEAQAEAETRDVAKLAQLAQGGLKVVRTTVKVERQTDEHGVEVEVELERKTTTEELGPSEAALRWRLERRNPKRWGRRDQVELSGPEGGEIPVAVRAAELAKSLRNLQTKGNDDEGAPS